jgi:hypothetical protein
MEQGPLLLFRSAAFPAEPGEDEATNPGMFGKALATWLGARLRQRGMECRDVIAEDFAWCLPVGAGSERTYVACVSDGETEDGWKVFAFQDGKLLGKLFGRSKSSDSLASIHDAVKDVLQAAPEVEDLQEEPA